jgi:hypothetical protein
MDGLSFDRLGVVPTNSDQKIVGIPMRLNASALRTVKLSI